MNEAERRRRTDRIAVILQGVTAIVAVLALIISLSTLSSRVDDIQKQRIQGAIDTCRVFRTIIEAATPPSRKAAGQAFIKKIGVDSCVVFGRKVTHIPAGR